MTDDQSGTSPVSWAGMTAPRIRERAGDPGSILVVPVGSIEQHGHHLPVATDTILADAVATAAAEHVADEIPALVAPPIYPGFSPHHLGFGGSLSLSVEHLLAVIGDVVETGLRSGFDAVLLVNGHGGNGPVIGAATNSIGVDNPEVLITGITYFELAEPVIDEIRESETGGMGHGGEFETSLMLHLRPDLVDEDAFTGTPLEDPNEYATQDLFASGPLTVYRPFKAYTDSGAIGEPSLATAEKGAELYDELIAELAALLFAIHAEVV